MDAPSMHLRTTPRHSIVALQSSIQYLGISYPTLCPGAGKLNVGIVKAIVLADFVELGELQQGEFPREQY